jgi:hypothetical protein
MKSEEEIRRRCKKLFKEYQDLGSMTSSTDHELDIALAKYEALNWVFYDEE